MGIRTFAVNPVTPVKGLETAQTLVSATAVAASGAWTYSSIVDVSDCRDITLYIKVSAATAASAYVGIKPMISAVTPEPLAGDDSWYGLSDIDSVAPTDLSGTVPTGADWTLSPESGVRTARELVIRTEASNIATDEQRIAATLDVSGARSLMLAYAELGATGSPSVLGISYARHT